MIAINTDTICAFDGLVCIASLFLTNSTLAVMPPHKPCPLQYCLHTNPLFSFVFDYLTILSILRLFNVIVIWLSNRVIQIWFIVNNPTCRFNCPMFVQVGFKNGILSSSGTTHVSSCTLVNSCSDCKYVIVFTCSASSSRIATNTSYKLRISGRRTSHVPV